MLILKMVHSFNYYERFINTSVLCDNECSECDLFRWFDGVYSVGISIGKKYDR